MSVSWEGFLIILNTHITKKSIIFANAEWNLEIWKVLNNTFCSSWMTKSRYEYLGGWTGKILEFYQMKQLLYNHPYFILLNPKDIRPFWEAGSQILNCPLKITDVKLNTQPFRWNDKTIINQIIPLKLSCWIPWWLHHSESQSCFSVTAKTQQSHLEQTWNLKLSSSPSRLCHDH